MKRAEDILIVARGITKLYEQYVDEIRKEKNLSYIEIAIMIFLHNNPNQDTAKDIVEKHMLQKGNVSQGIDSLISKKYLERNSDEKDKRIIHLSLTEHAAPLIKRIEKKRKMLMDAIFNDFTKEELELYTKLNKKIHINTLRGLEGN